MACSVCISFAPRFDFFLRGSRRRWWSERLQGRQRAGAPGLVCSDFAAPIFFGCGGGHGETRIHPLVRRKAEPTVIVICLASPFRHVAR
jgi:hypothetical protein